MVPTRKGYPMMAANPTRPFAATTELVAPERPPFDGESATDVVRSTVNALFSAGLELCSARGRINDDVARDRIDWAIAELDEVIAELRSRTAGFDVIDLTDDGPSAAGDGSL